MGKIREYKADGITVRYDAQRCIHAEACVHGLDAVFNPNRRPWIDASGASPDEVASAIHACPTGALSYERTDGGAQETPGTPTLSLAVDGPLYVQGGVPIMDHEGNVVVSDSRVALCRCGASKNKPYCDNTHLEVGFVSASDDFPTT